MRKKAIEIMFCLCFVSPSLLYFLNGKEIYIQGGDNSSLIIVLIILYLPVIFLLPGFENIKMSAGMILQFTYAIITFCIGSFLTITLSWWYLLVSAFAFTLLLLLVTENYKSR